METKFNYFNNARFLKPTHTRNVKAVDLILVEGEYCESKIVIPNVEEKKFNWKLNDEHDHFSDARNYTIFGGGRSSGKTKRMFDELNDLHYGPPPLSSEEVIEALKRMKDILNRKK